MLYSHVLLNKSDKGLLFTLYGETVCLKFIINFKIELYFIVTHASLIIIAKSELVKTLVETVTAAV